jgi:hypothetical protein
MMPATGRIPAGRRLRIEVSPAEGRGAVPGFERAYDESYHRGILRPRAKGSEGAVAARAASVIRSSRPYGT